MSGRDVFNEAAGGFYQGSIDDDGLSLADAVDIGVGSLWRSQYPELLAHLDVLIGSDPTTIVEAWAKSYSSYVWTDAAFITKILRLMRDNVAERIASGRGLPG